MSEPPPLELFPPDEHGAEREWVKPHIRRTRRGDVYVEGHWRAKRPRRGKPAS